MVHLMLIAVGAVVLVWGADAVVAGARALAARVGVSGLVVGLTVTSVGTSLPEIATNLAAAVRTAGGGDASGIAVGNIVGSNLSQITLLMGLTGIAATLSVPPETLRRDGPAAVAALLLMLLACLDQQVTRVEGGLLALTYLAWLAWLMRGMRRQPGPVASDVRRPWLRFAVGLVAVVGGAHLLVDQGQQLARSVGLSDELVGVLVGVGTGLPELAVSLQAARKGDSALALGNLMGSNITDPLLSFGLGAAVTPVIVAPVVLRVDFPVWGIATLLCLGLLWTRRRLERWEGLLLVAVFLAYTAARLAMEQ